jgi:soluble lytic murein transglycosylase-like protein
MERRLVYDYWPVRPATGLSPRARLARCAAPVLAVLAVVVAPALVPRAADGLVAPTEADRSLGAPTGSVQSYTLCPLPAALRPPFVLAARGTGLPLSVLVAVARVESRLDQSARSPAGAVGVLQVLPETARSVGLDGEGLPTNVLAGARYLRGLVDRFGSLELALAAYNAGPTAVERFGGAPTGQTLTYVANVRELIDADPACR